MNIYPVCPKCGNKLTVKLNIVDKLQIRIKQLEAQLRDKDGFNALNELFGGFKK
jgi:transcription initiation factor IIE alpha subunit